VSDSALGVAQPTTRITFLIPQLGAYLADQFERRLAPIGVDPRAYAVLLALGTRDGQSQRELSARLGIHRNVMVSVIDTLEHQQLVQRLRQPQDRRAFAVTLTDEARDLLPSLDDLGRTLENELTATLSAPERAVLLDLLQRASAEAGLIPGVHSSLR
jgi:DNA-binding MarR family transcriptional regulator